MPDPSRIGSAIDPAGRRRRRLLPLIAVIAAVALLGAACGDDDSNAAPSATEAEPAADTSGETVTTYTSGSDVTSHAAIGKDVAAIKDHLAAAKDGKPVDWVAVNEVFTNGGGSKKGDGSIRTLATLLDAPDDLVFIRAAIAGGDSDAIRAQGVEKGITVLLARKVLQELDAAAGKVADGDTDAAEGAPHNVDEAWAFYVADGSGPSSTAQKRAADFGLEGKVHEAVIAALIAAQTASGEGDETTFEKAEAEVTSALNYVFYLATYKYLDTQNDPVRRAEGLAFYRGIAPTLRAGAPDVHASIEQAFEANDAVSGRAALNSAESLSALGLEAWQAITT